MGKSKKYNKDWIIESPKIKKIIEKNDKRYWLDKLYEYIEMKINSEKAPIPTITGFFRTLDIYPLYLQDNITQGKYKREHNEDLLDKWELINKVIKQSAKKIVINKNIDKASFAAQYLAQEQDWDKDSVGAGQGNISINLLTFGDKPSLPPSDSPVLPPVNSNEECDIIDVEVIDVSTEQIEKAQDNGEIIDLQDSLNKLLKEKERE